MRSISTYIDLAFCIAVLPAMAIIFPVERWYHNFPWYVICVGVWLYSAYFVNRALAVPALFGNRRSRIAGLMIVVLSIAVTYALSKVQLYTPKPSVYDYGINRVLPAVNQYQQAVWSLFVIVEAFSFAVGLLTQTNVQRSRRRAVEAERDKAIIELYKAQIKPHFMFNTLNSLYGLFLTGNDRALTSLEKFISMMRYIHTSSMREMVPLAEEVEYIREYVDLQSLRLNEMTAVKLDISVEQPNLPVPPMLLVTFVENCFKHGASPVEQSTILIKLIEKDGVVAFSTSNHIFPVQRIGEHAGIANCRKRLELLYPGRHELSIESDKLRFEVKLLINLSL